MVKPVVLIATRKGAFILIGDAKRRRWRIDGPHFLGSVINHLVLDPRDGKTLLMAARDGHLGPTVFRSRNWGKTWKEAKRPPAFAKAKASKKASGKASRKGRIVSHVFCLSPGHGKEKKVWYAGVSPQALFRSEDSGITWKEVKGFNDHKMHKKWTAGADPPDGAILHSILVDPLDARHLYIGMSAGGVFESTDGGKDWRPLNKGTDIFFEPPGDYEYGHDPHCVAMHPLHPNRLYQQNHCGIYRLDRPSDTWTRIGKKMPKQIGDVGFPIVLHPRNPDVVWVFPMDATTVWPRVSPGGKPAVYCSDNGGKSWFRQDKGLPRSQGWFTVKRQCFAADGYGQVGLYFGTTSGEVWMSRNEGGSWSCIASHLPHIYSVETALW